MKKLKRIFSTSEISDIDVYTIDFEQIKSIDLMERAACVWVDFFCKKFGYVQKIAIVCGWGNNGGDGFAIARLLKERKMEVVVYRLMTESVMSLDCETNYQRYLVAGGVVVEVFEEDEMMLEDDVVVIDAIFGAGLNRPVVGLAAQVIRKINSLSLCVVAVDIPSGLMGEDNAMNDRKSIMQADYTFTFQFPKLSFMLAENADYVGEWSVLDIGLHSDGFIGKSPYFYYLTEQDVAGWLPRAKKFAHKGINGRGLLVAGSLNMMGAAILAAKAAMRSGIGLLTCHVPGVGRDIMHLSVAEALVDADICGSFFSGIQGVEKYDAVAVGPGIGRGPDTVAGLSMLLKQWRGVTILDADALNIMAEHRELLNLLHEGCILTPHLKEFERLVGKCVNDFERLNKLSTFASLFHVNVVLKGAHSVVASPDGVCYFNMSGNPGMAKGGAGDVLTGVLLALAANGIEPLKAALIGVYAHGLAGDMVAEEVGERGVCAGILAEGMGRAWKRLEDLTICK